MIGAYKPYEQARSDQYDTPGRAFVKNIAKLKWNVDAADYETYKVDLICKRNGVVIGYAEVEVREPYTDKFPYDTVHVPSRKDKLMANGLPTVYFVVSKNFDRLMWIRTDKIEKYSQVEVPNKLVPNGEMFYDVPKGLFKEVRVYS
jgi:hypothetical protein